MTNATQPKLLKQQPLSGWLKRLIPDNLRGEKPFNLGEHFRQTRASVTPPDGWPASNNRTGTAPIWLLSRGCYTIRILDLGNVPAAKRDPAIRLAVAAWSPFNDTSHYIIPTKRGAILCAWDTNLVQRAMEQAGVSPDNVRIVPESALRREIEPASGASTGTETSAHVLSVIDGFTGAVVNAEGTFAEQWWAALPTPAQWQNFLRSAGLAASPNLLPPEPKNALWRGQANGYSANSQVTNFSANEAFAVWIFAVLLTVPTLWYGNQLRQVYAAKQESGERLRQTEKDLDSVLSSRELALSTQDRAAKLAELFDKADHLQLFALVNDVVIQNAAPNTLQLSEWEVRPQLLKFALVATAGAPPAATTLVKALERVQIFRDVEAKLDGSRINVTVRLIPNGKIATPEPLAQPTNTNAPPLKKALSGASLPHLCYPQPCAQVGGAIAAPATRREA